MSRHLRVSADRTACGRTPDTGRGDVPERPATDHTADPADGITCRSCRRSMSATSSNVIDLAVERDRRRS